METLYTGHFVHTFPCGLRLICAPCPTEVVYCGIAIDAGTRDELNHESGMAHFTEHMSFKGTAKRRAWHIVNRMESVGGDLNAFTGKEETVYYCTCLKPHLSRAIDVLVDIVLGSTYPQREMDREVEVVASEIESYNDSPSELIYDEFESLLFANHPLGRNILGDADALRLTTQAQMQQFARRLYQPERMVCFVYGQVKPEQVVRMLEKQLAQYATEPALCSASCAAPRTSVPRAAVPEYAPQTVSRDMDTHQAHVMMGCRGFGGLHKQQLPLFLLNNLLGGPGMNSRLCQTLREKRGLVYTVESSLTTYTDTGVWSVYFGCESGKVNQCKALVLREMERLADKPLSDAALAALKKRVKGQIGLSYDMFENVAVNMAKRFLHYHRVQQLDNLFARIDEISAQQILDTAQQLFRPEQITTLIYT